MRKKDKEYKVNIKYIKVVDLNVIARNKKEVEKILKDTFKNTNVINNLNTDDENYIYNIMEIE